MVTTPYRTETSSRTHRIAGVVAAMVLGIASLSACGESTLAPLPLQISVTTNRTSAAPGDTVYFGATVQGGQRLGLDADYGDNTVDQFGASGARTGKITFHHAYAARGTFTTKITVTDATLGTASASVEIRVN